mmetsp:Transcript_7919/g.16970  ORF Transcript_7919/g.16970 Transcript_7919/m.16970 type:complete len:385 (-) Transcript_7919:63-1217(-)
MYRPPNRILLHGSLEKALEIGARNHKWILVNIQSHNEFSSMVLNRDVWGDDAVQALVGSAFYLWQRYVATADGERYKTYYPFDNLPHIALLDPRTGESLLTWESSGEPTWTLSCERLLADLTDFLDAHSLQQDSIGPAHLKKSRALEEFAAGSAVDDLGYGAASSAGAAQNAPSSSMMDEDAQIAAAIAASISDHVGNSAAGDSGGVSADTEMLGASPEYNRILSSAASRENPELNEQRHIIREQDEEYQMALAIDRSKAEMRKQEQLQAERVALESQRTQQEHEDRKERTALRVPPEPGADVPQSQTTELAIRLPSGERLVRRFHVDNTIENVLDYISANTGHAEGAFDLMSPFPRRTFTNAPHLTLGDAKLAPKAALVVHEH